MASVLQPPPPPACTGGTLHTVVSGETLSSIAAAFGITLDTLVTANPQLISVGQVLCVPTAPTSPCCLTLAPSAAAPATAGGTVFLRRVAGGFTLLVSTVNLPLPASFGPFTTYFARVMAPQQLIEFPLSATTATPLPVTAGAISSSVIPLPTAAMIEVLPGAAGGARGPVVLLGNLAGCH